MMNRHIQCLKSMAKILTGTPPNIIHFCYQDRQVNNSAKRIYMEQLNVQKHDTVLTEKKEEMLEFYSFDVILLKEIQDLCLAHYEKINFAFI